MIFKILQQFMIICIKEKELFEKITCKRSYAYFERNQFCTKIISKVNFIFIRNIVIRFVYSKCGSFYKYFGC